MNPPPKKLAVVFGHSFVRRLKEYTREKHIVHLGMDPSVYFVILHGVGGLKVGGQAVQESQLVVDLEPSTIILDMGANDLDCVSAPSPVQVASDVFQFACDLKDASSAERIVLMQAYPRTSPRRYDYNTVLTQYNDHLSYLCSVSDHSMIYHKLTNIWQGWPDLLVDGVHFNSTGIQKYFRNVRGAVIKSFQD